MLLGSSNYQYSDMESFYKACIYVECMLVGCYDHYLHRSTYLQLHVCAYSILV